MSKLKVLPTRLGSLAPTVNFMASSTRSEAQRGATAPWRSWYKTSRWQKLRMSILIRDGFTCQRSGCGRLTADTSQLVADHREPHRGDASLFWDEGNLQCLCKACHDRHKQREERRGT